MGFEYLTNVPLAQARKEYLERLVSGGFGSKTETIPVFESCGRVTAKAVYAHICAPHYAASAMDGVAVSAKETFGATERFVIGPVRRPEGWPPHFPLCWTPATRFRRTKMQSSWWRTL